MKKINFPLIAFVFWASITCGMMISDVGEMPKQRTEPYDYWMPIAGFFIFAINFMLGWFAHKSHNQD